MGRGNVSVNGPYEGLFYIDREDVDLYTLKKDGEIQVRLLRDMEQDDFKYWSFSPDLSRIAMDDILENLKFEFMARFSSFGEVDDWISRDRQAILESNLFYVALEDNEWSLAVELIQKDDFRLYCVQKHHYNCYLNAIKEILLGMLPSIGTYAGPWTSGRITKEELL